MRAPAFWWKKPGAASALLSPVAAIYGTIAMRRLRHPGERAGIPVICVGNLTVGGAGKTPAAIAVARMLIAAGEKPIFLTRGAVVTASPRLIQAKHVCLQLAESAAANWDTG